MLWRLLFSLVLPALLAGADANARRTIVVFGDSIAAGFGVEPGAAFPEQLQKEIDKRGIAYRIVNLGISGDTTSGGVARMAGAIAQKPAVVVLELGGNDGLRGLPLKSTRANLDTLIAGFEKAGAKILLAGMTLPRNYGPEYIRGFEQIYVDLAKRYRLAFIPFVMEGVAGTKQLMQPDAIHPTAEGHRRIAALVWKTLAPMLRP